LLQIFQQIESFSAHDQLLLYEPSPPFRVGLSSEPNFGEKLQSHVSQMGHGMIEPLVEDFFTPLGKGENVSGGQVFLSHPFVDHETFPLQFDQKAVNLTLA
jgi:hypothetical protein